MPPNLLIYLSLFENLIYFTVDLSINQEYTTSMDISFSWIWFTGGLLVIIAGIVFLRFHAWVADNFGSGVVDYERYRLYALIAIGIGFLAMLNLVPILLGLILGLLFNNSTPV